MAEFNDRRSGKKVDLAAEAVADAKRDSRGAYGRQHGSAWNYSKHHSAEKFEPLCKACKSDAAKGTHPLA
jgi:hypothetical protein